MATTNLRTGLMTLLATAIVIAFVGGALVVMINDGDDDVAAPTTSPATTVVVEDTSPATLPPPTTAADTDSSEGGLPRDDTYPGGEADLVPLPPMGLDETDFAWTVTELISSTGGESWIHQLVEIEGALWALGGSYDETSDTEQSFVFTSTDGVTWEHRDLPAEIREAGHAQVGTIDPGLIAIVNAWDSTAQRPELSVFVTTDGQSWTRSDPSTVLGPDRQMWINHSAGSNGIVILAGAHGPVVDEPYEPPVITIEHDGYSIELDEATWSYLITDIASGEIVSHGSQEMIWNHQGEDQFGMYDPAVGEVIFPMTWEDLDLAGSTTYETVAWGDPMLVSITSGDRTLTLDEYTGTVTIVDSDGAVLFEGTERDMWQGAPPTFRDRNGDVVVVVPWDVWEAAHSDAYGGPVENDMPTPVILRSADSGATWQDVDIDDLVDDDFYFQTLRGGPDGFLGIGTNEAMYEDYLPADVAPPVVLRSDDGLSWTVADTDLKGNDWLSAVEVTSDGYVAVRGGAEIDSEVVLSADGATWEPMLTQDDLLLELGHVWFDRPASGELGTFVSGSYDGYTQAEATTAQVNRDGRTLTILGPEYTVTDDATGAVLFTFNEMEAGFHEDPVGAPPSGFKWGQGGIVMFDDDGGVIFAASHRQFEEAMSDTWDEPEHYYEMQQVLFYSDGVQWTQVPLPEGLGPHAWLSGIVVTDTSVVMTYTSETQSGHDFSIRCLAVVGVPVP